MNGLQAAIVSGSALIFITLLLRAALRRRLPARLFPALWCVAAARLLLPVSIPTHISIWNLFSTRAASGAKRRVEQKHDLYGHQKMHRQGCD